MSLSMERWRDKVAVVTGASAGIGAAIAEKLVKNGLQVVGFARRKEKVEELAKSLNPCIGKLHGVSVDVTKEEDILAAFKWVRDNLGPVHVLVNNAGILRNTTLIEGDTKLWKEVFDTNVLGLCICTREAIKDMKANNINGHIVHINSVAGHVIRTSVVNVYPASKFAVTALTETLRLELNDIGSTIKISSVSPGLVATEIFETGAEQSKSDTEPPFKEILNVAPSLRPSDVADAVVYVLSTPPHVQVHELTIRSVGISSSEALSKTIKPQENPD